MLWRLAGLLILLSLLPGVAVFPACASPSTSPEEYELQLAQKDSSLQSVSAQQEDLQTEYAKLKQALAETVPELEQIKQERDDLKRLAGRRPANPTWAEVKQLLERDETDKIKYDLDTFNCQGFTLSLRDRATADGIRGAFVAISFTVGEGHAVNAFETSDKGLVYIEPQADAVAYVKNGEQFGTIPLDGLRTELIALPTPETFWKERNYVVGPDPFSYAYFTLYNQRLDFYKKSSRAYGETVERRKVGKGDLTQAQLDSWRDNLKALREEFGKKPHEAGEIVRVIQVYWNDKTR